MAEAAKVFCFWPASAALTRLAFSFVSAAMPPPHRPKPRVGAGLDLLKFARARQSGHDARAARAAETARAAKRVNKLKKLKARLAAEGKLQVGGRERERERRRGGRRSITPR